MASVSPFKCGSIEVHSGRKTTRQTNGQHPPFKWGKIENAVTRGRQTSAKKKLASISPFKWGKMQRERAADAGRGRHARGRIEPNVGGRRQWLLTVANRELLRQFQTGLRVSCHSRHESGQFAPPGLGPSFPSEKRAKPPRALAPRGQDIPT